VFAWVAVLCAILSLWATAGRLSIASREILLGGLAVLYCLIPLASPLLPAPWRARIIVLACFGLALAVRFEEGVLMLVSVWCMFLTFVLSVERDAPPHKDGPLDLIRTSNRKNA
jgi:hypothetical protein